MGADGVGESRGGTRVPVRGSDEIGNLRMRAGVGAGATVEGSAMRAWDSDERVEKGPLLPVDDGACNRNKGRGDIGVDDILEPL